MRSMGRLGDSIRPRDTKAEMGLLILIAALLAGEAQRCRNSRSTRSMAGRPSATLERLNGQRSGLKSEPTASARSNSPKCDSSVRHRCGNAGALSLSSAVGPKSSKPPGRHLGNARWHPALRLRVSSDKGVREAEIAFRRIAQCADEIHPPRRVPSRRQKAGRWPELPKDAAGDLIVVQKKEAVDLVEGIVGDVTAETVQFSVDGDVVPVKRAEVVGLVYFHSQRLAMRAGDRGDRRKSRPAGRSGRQKLPWSMERFAVTTTFGGTLAIGRWNAVPSIDFSPSRMVYLSDLPPESAEWTPCLDFGKRTETLSQFYKPQVRLFARRRHRCSIGGKTYRKGVAMAARTVLEYKIAGRGQAVSRHRRDRRFGPRRRQHQADVEGDGKNLYTGKITGHDKPADLKFDVSGVKRLRIMADFGGGADVGDYLDLGDARIVK